MHPLEQAAELIEAYRATLNMNSEACECCGMTKYENFGEFVQYKELGGVLTKLRRFANTPTTL